MPIEVFCDSCQKKLRVPDTAAGKRIKCPKCQGVISVPAAAGGSGSLSGSIPTPSKLAGSKSSSSISVPKSITTPKSGLGKAIREQWHVQTEDGQQYGPVSRQELDQWHADGRITVDTQLLRDGGDQWQWASDIYPDLAPQDEAPATSGIPDFGAMASGGGAATSSGPFDFSAGAGSTSSSTSVSSRGKGKKGGKKSGGRGKKGGGSPHIDYVAYAFYGYGALGILAMLVMMMTFMGAASALPADAPREVKAAAATFSTFVMVGSIIGMILCCVNFAAGYGLQQRASWGRILTLILAALNILSFPLGTAIGVWAFMVLLDKDNAATFS